MGRFGSIHLVSATTKELLRSLKMNDWCRELRFSRDGGSLYTFGEGGEVYIWDVRSEITSSHHISNCSSCILYLKCERMFSDSHYNSNVVVFNLAEIEGSEGITLYFPQVS